MEDNQWSDDAPTRRPRRDVPKKKNPAAKSAPKSKKAAGKSKKDANGGGESKNQRSLRLTADAIAVLEAFTAQKKQTKLKGLKHQGAFVSKLLCEYGEQILHDDFPVLRDSLPEYMAARLEYLESVVVKQQWEVLCGRLAKKAKEFYAFIEKSGFKPHSVNMDEIRAWAKDNNSRCPNKRDITTVAYAVHFGLECPNSAKNKKKAALD